MKLNPKYIVNGAGKRLSVILTMKEYNWLLEHLTDIEDAKLYDKVKARKEEHTPIDEYLHKRKKK